MTRTLEVPATDPITPVITDADERAAAWLARLLGTAAEGSEGPRPAAEAKVGAHGDGRG